MPKVRVEPEGLEFEAAAGQTIMAAAQEAGLYWPTTCGGEGVCTTCSCIVEKGGESLTPMGRSELRTLTSELPEPVVRKRRLRLACQARVHGDVVVSKRGVRRAGGTPAGRPEAADR